MPWRIPIAGAILFLSACTNTPLYHCIQAAGPQPPHTLWVLLGPIGGIADAHTDARAAWQDGVDRCVARETAVK